ncbi:HMG-box [Coprinopsis marcescibilis]|uniref:HMG-box n=1 Tax=Coprinopsis marcescibilis TaxID=230819 RepID=A0A5C3LD71_COPMA|nr:HMG-box [Coprinopsis marcescibilis]
MYSISSCVHPNLWEMPSIAYDMIPSGGGYHCSSSANSTKSVSPLSPPSTSSPTFSTSSLRIGQSKKGKSHISRPPNAFLLFRSEFWAREKQKKNPVERDHRDISRIAAHCWRSLDDTAKQVYYQRASKLREQHQIQYPTYKFTPAPRKTRKKSKKTDENDARCALLASQLMPEYVPSYSPPLPIVNATDWNRLPILQPTPRLPEQPNPIIGFESAFGDNNSSTIPFSAYPVSLFFLIFAFAGI